jgi:CheY-like chemotaxis protein
MQQTHSTTRRAATCLVVDDDQFSAAVLREILQQGGLVHVETATTGKRALQALAGMKSAPDLLICDLYMPEMDGIELMAQLGQQHYPGGIVLVSGENIECLAIARQVAAEDGLNVIGAFTKPLGRDLLLAVLTYRLPKVSGAWEAHGC